MNSESIESEPLDGWRLRVAFQKQGDRYCTGVWMVGNDAEKLLLTSAAEHGPVFQELHTQADRQGRPIALLTGMADQRYWSASIAAGAADLEFDLACRRQDERRTPSAAWDLAPHLECQPADPPAYQLTTAAAPPCVLAPGDGCRVSWDARRLTTSPTQPGRPLQWAFTLSLEAQP